MSDTHDQRITRGAEVLAEAMGRSNCGPRFDAARESWERIVRAVLDAVSPQEDLLAKLCNLIDREYERQGNPPAMDFVKIAANEVRGLHPRTCGPGGTAMSRAGSR